MGYFFLGVSVTVVVITVYRWFSSTVAVWRKAYTDGYKEKYGLNLIIAKQKEEIDKLEERIRFLECDGYRYPNKPSQEI